MKTVLLIDDHMELLDMIGEVLVYEGYRVLKAGNATGGIALAKAAFTRHHPVRQDDPGQSGRDVRDYLQARADAAHIPLAFIRVTKINWDKLLPGGPQCRG
jgi:CheY-like chemotaxis protein